MKLIICRSVLFLSLECLCSGQINYWPLLVSCFNVSIKYPKPEAGQTVILLWGNHNVSKNMDVIGLFIHLATFVSCSR